MSQHTDSLLRTDALQNLKGARIAIVHTEWNDKIVAEQLSGCRKIAKQFGATITDTIAVPGSFEIPFACKQLWAKRALQKEESRPEAIIAFGAVIRGGTPHFEYVCNAVTDGIAQLNLTLPIPVIFGVLTVDNETQAWERLGGTHGHKGEEAAITALKMVHLNNSL
jgi:6,7-dimethyl-8-ribityllumazine synthase